MTFKDMISTSVGNLWRRKLRTFLTVLGVLIGTTSIVAMLSIALGMKQMVMEQFTSYGSANQISIYQGYGDKGGSGIDYMLSDTNIEKFSQIEHVTKVNTTLELSSNMTYGKYQGWGSIVGISSDEMATLELEKGSLAKAGNGATIELVAGNMIPIQFYDTSSENMDNSYWATGKLPDVDLFSNRLKFTMYNENAISDTPVEGEPFVDNTMVDLRARVVGLMSGGPEEYKNHCYEMVADIESLKTYLTKNFKKGQIPGQPKDSNGQPYKEWIYTRAMVEVDSPDNVEVVQTTIRDMGFEASSNRDFLESTQKTFRIIEIVLGGIGMIAFLVAAIGIANTMMMSTYERTKEIGVMKVLGCDMKDIMGMFLCEAGFIGFLGGVVGTAITFGLSKVANIALAGIVADQGIGNGDISIIPIWLVLVAIAFSTLMGVVAGFFPARRAMRLSPLAAIRNE